jgi:4-oxalocrotonate tautomerase
VADDLKPRACWSAADPGLAGELLELDRAVVASELVLCWEDRVEGVIEQGNALINVKLIEDVFTSEQKGQIVERLTDAMVSIEGENMRGVTWVVVEEVRSGDWGIGGQALSTEAVKALAAGTPA